MVVTAQPLISVSNFHFNDGQQYSIMNANAARALAFFCNAMDRHNIIVTGIRQRTKKIPFAVQLNTINIEKMVLTKQDRCSLLPCDRPVHLNKKVSFVSLTLCPCGVERAVDLRAVP